MEKDNKEIIKFLEENRGKRKFKQSVELAINFKSIDFTKQDNKLNLEIMLPNGKGKVKKLAIFATDRILTQDATKNGIEVFDGTQIDKIATDRNRLNSLLDYDLFAQPSLMPTIAKTLGQFLGPRNAMPKPLLGNFNLVNITNEMTKKIVLKNKGKNLPTIHCVIGSEDMEAQKISENANEVLSAVSKKLGQNRIKSVFLKLTMSKPIKIM